MSIIYGLYHVSRDDVPMHIANAHAVGIKNFDTAQLYNNEQPCVEACTDTDHIITKIYYANDSNKIHNRMKQSLRRFGPHPINEMLLHRPMPNECWKALVSYPIASLGVSNYDLGALNNLLSYCAENQLPRPMVHQMEVHPFVDCVELISFCQKNGIRVVGHTVLAQGKFLNYGPVLELASKYHVSPAQIMVAWARSKKIDICVNSKSMDHLKALMDFVSLETSDLEDMDRWHLKVPHRFYGKVNMVPYSLNGVDGDRYLGKVVEQLIKDREADYPSNICEHLATSGESYRTVGRAIAQLLFGDESGNAQINKYRNLVKDLKTKRMAHHKTAKMAKKGLSCCVVRRTSGPYSESITNPKPMPVDVSDPNEFNLFFDYLKSAEAPPQSDTVFIRGAMFPDGRMDLCKQVVGPESIERLCDTVLESKIVKHFLLGNNVALQENEETGAQAFARLINGSQVQTYYLAGNNIGSKGIKIMAEALETNHDCKALWLKRNPIGSLGASYLNAMLKMNTTLVLLDLHNCALGDEGVTNLLAGELPALKHLYLDANGIESTTAVAQWCRTGRPVTLFMSINRLGDQNIMELARALTNSTTLKRLCLASTHLENAGVKALVEMALSCPKLRSLDLGCYKSTGDLGEHPGNFYDDTVLSDLVRLLESSSSLKYLNTVNCKISAEGLLSLPRVPWISLDLGVGPWHHVHEPGILRTIKQPKRVIHIDSIYRGKM